MAATSRSVRMAYGAPKRQQMHDAVVGALDGAPHEMSLRLYGWC
jgi:hypothetical protein